MCRAHCGAHSEAATGPSADCTGRRPRAHVPSRTVCRSPSSCGARPSPLLFARRAVLDRLPMARRLPPYRRTSTSRRAFSPARCLCSLSEPALGSVLAPLVIDRHRLGAGVGKGQRAGRSTWCRGWRGRAAVASSAPKGGAEPAETAARERGGTKGRGPARAPAWYPVCGHDAASQLRSAGRLHRPSASGRGSSPSSIGRLHTHGKGLARVSRSRSRLNAAAARRSARTRRSSSASPAAGPCRWSASRRC